MCTAVTMCIIGIITMMFIPCNPSIRWISISALHDFCVHVFVFFLLKNVIERHVITLVYRFKYSIGHFRNFRKVTTFRPVPVALSLSPSIALSGCCLWPGLKYQFQWSNSGSLLAQLLVCYYSLILPSFYLFHYNVEINVWILGKVLLLSIVTDGVCIHSISNLHLIIYA